MKRKLTSRKFLLACVSAFLVIANEGLGWNLDANTVMSFAGIVIAYILGEAAVDAKKNGG